MSGKPMVSGSGSGDGNDELSDWKAVRLKFGPEPGKVSLLFICHLHCEFFSTVQRVSETM